MKIPALKEERNDLKRQRKKGEPSLFRYKLTLEYDGTGYSGWQIQKNARSIQGVLLDCASNLFGEKVEIQGAGRTDAGVHALAQVAHLEAAHKLPSQKILFELNERLPATINILDVEEARADFHARHSALSKSYIYILSRRRSAFLKKYVWWIKDSLDTEIMRQAIAIFNGFHDFSSFADKRIDKHLSTKVAVEKTELAESGDLIVFRIVASHFLWKMVRRIVGMMVETGRGNLSITDVKHILDNPSEVPAHYTSPPSGLFLEKVIYEGDKLPPLGLPYSLSFFCSGAERKRSFNEKR
jgi:tRNA pseudouridine38-40 synthase